MITIIVSALIVILVLGLITAGASVRVVQQFERGVVFRFGRVQPTTRGPGLALITPFADRLQKVCMQSSPSRSPRRTASPATTSPSASTPSSTTA
jgi:regulator of protease activity HflC (stomatin/prohibitin superfamily)